MVRGLYDVKMGNTYHFNALRKLKFWWGCLMVWGKISSLGVGLIVCFHGNINASVSKKKKQTKKNSPPACSSSFT